MTGAVFEWTDKQPLTEAARRAVTIASLEVLRDAVRAAPRDTGTLKRSYTIAEHQSGDIIGAYVGTNLHYAPYVEFGTRRMAARPHLGPALEKARRKFGFKR